MLIQPAGAPPYTQEMARGMSETTLQSNIVGLAQTLGWLPYHTHDSRRSQRGFPDLVLAHGAQGRLILAELKTEKGRTRPDQFVWHTQLRLIAERIGIEVYLWRPTGWLDGTITRILQRKPRPA